MLLTRLRFLLAPIALLSLTSCASEPLSTPDFETHGAAIAGGYDDDDTRSVVGIVRLSNWGGVGICSGTLIAPNVVLTAQHCVAPINNSAGNGGVQCGVSNFGSAYPAYQLYVSTDSELAQNGDWYPAKAIHVVPGDGNVCGQDIAVMVLQDPIPSSVAKPRVPRVDEIVQVDALNGVFELYSAVGYGNINDDWGSGRRRRRDTLHATCVAQWCPIWTSVQQSEWIGDTGVCQGDSGGPALDSVGRVIGVASRGGAGCSSPVYGGVWEWADWLMDKVATATAEAGLEVPNWSLGYPTDPKYNHPVGEACSDSAECDSGMCETGFCTRRCIAEAPCPDGWKCSADNGICRPAPVGAVCIGDDQCDSGMCEKGRCTRFCDDVIGCPPGYGCNVASWCELYPVGDTCELDADCPSDLCQDGVCSRACDGNAPCPAPFGCDPVTSTCQTIPLSSPCAADDECAGGTCLDGSCTRACSSAQPCPSTHTCGTETGLCEPIPIGGGCADDSECGGGSCIDGSCTSGCATNSDCLSGYSCTDGTCTLIAVGGECSTDADCDGGTCDAGTCTRSCGIQAPCPTGAICTGASGVCIALPPVSTQPGSGCTSASSPSSPPWVAVFMLALVAVLRRRGALSPRRRAS